MIHKISENCQKVSSRLTNHVLGFWYVISKQKQRTELQGLLMHWNLVLWDRTPPNSSAPNYPAKTRDVALPRCVIWICLFCYGTKCGSQTRIELTMSKGLIANKSTFVRFRQIPSNRWSEHPNQHPKYILSVRHVVLSIGDIKDVVAWQNNKTDALSRWCRRQNVHQR